MIHPRNLNTASIGAMVLTGCAAMPRLGPAPSPITAKSLTSSISLSAPSSAWPVDQWWHRNRDPQLDRLISAALTGSPSLAIAAARVRRADAAVGQVRAVNDPQITLSGSLAEAKASYWNGVPYAGVPKGVNDAAALRLGLDWNLDFFGRNRAAIAAAISGAEAARADAAQARLVLTTGVAGSYADLLGQSRERVLAADTVRVRERMLELVAQRRSQGLETLASEAQAASTLESARQALSAATEAGDLTRLRIAALTGAGRRRAFDRCAN